MLAKAVWALRGDNEKSKRTANKTEKREKVCLFFASFAGFIMEKDFYLSPTTACSPSITDSRPTSSITHC
jgi:hypothetical protein